MEIIGEERKKNQHVFKTYAIAISNCSISIFNTNITPVLNISIFILL